MKLMFELFSAGIFAFNQALLILMALLCLGLGALLLGYEVRWRLGALRVQGTIVGVREKEPGMFRSVYRYSLPSGESFEATSNVGSNSAKGRETGRRVELLVFADKPEEVSEAGNAVAGIFGGLLALVGLWPLHAALTSGPIALLTWVMLIGGVAYIAQRMRRHVIPKGERLSPVQWREKGREKHRAGLAAVPVRRIEEILATPQATERRRRDRKTYRILRPILVLAGAGMIVLAVYLGRDLAQLKASGQRAPGSVVALRESSDSDGSTYYPVVRFVAIDGAAVEFKDKVGSNPPSHRVGDAVTVLYRGTAREHDAIIDRGGWNWLPTVLLAVLGGFLLFAGFRMSVGSRGESGTPS